MTKPDARFRESKNRWAKISFVPDAGHAFKDFPVKDWVDHFKIKLSNSAIDVVIETYDEIGQRASGGDSDTRSLPDDFIAISTSTYWSSPPASVLLFVEAAKGSNDGKLRCWLIKLEADETPETKEPIWHKLVGQAAKGRRFHRVNENAAVWGDEMTEAAENISGHTNCLTHQFKHCPRSNIPPGPSASSVLDIFKKYLPFRPR